METSINALQTATQVMHNAGGRAVKTHLTFTLGSGLTCLLILGAALCVHVGLGMMKIAPKTELESEQSLGSAASGSDAGDHGYIIDDSVIAREALMFSGSPSGASANDIVKRYHELQLQELANYRLNHTEQNVAILMLIGKTNRDIAASLSMSESSVKKYVQRILTKTGAANRKELSHIIQSKLVQKAH